MATRLMPQQLKETRRALFDTLELCSSADDHVAFQEQLAKDILHAESLKPRPNANKKERIAHKEHLRNLRHYGDALAWVVLHAHAIRNLAKNDGGPPWLSNQIAAVDSALNTIREIAKKDLTGVICDLTNVLRIGDVVFGDPEAPSIVELKNRVTERRKRLGRAGRQLSRMEGTVEYLTKGRAQVFGESYTRVVHESTVTPDYNWAALEELIASANRAGAATVVLSDHQVLFAQRSDLKFNLPEDKCFERFAGRHVMIGMLSRVLDECWSTIAAPFIWGLPAEQRFQLMEREIELGQVLSVDAFIGMETSEGKIIGVDQESGPFGPNVLVEIDDTTQACTANMLMQALYGFQTVESVGRSLIEFAASTSNLEQLVAEELTETFKRNP